MPIHKKKIVEKVVAFEGEQDFIINPNKPDYISAGEVLYVEAQGTQISGGATGSGVVGDSPTGGTGTPQSVSYLIPDWNSLDCTALNTAIGDLSSWLSTNTANIPPAEVTYYNSELSKARSTFRTKCTNIPPPTPPPSDQTTYPKFSIPNWGSLTCDQIKLKVAELEKFIKDYDAKFITLDRLLYEEQLAKGKEQQNKTCAVQQPAPTPTPAPTTNVIIPPVFFGGGGGGLGRQPEETITTTTTTTEKKNGKINWFLLLLIAGGIYLYLKKKK